MAKRGEDVRVGWEEEWRRIGGDVVMATCDLDAAAVSLLER